MHPLTLLYTQLSGLNSHRSHGYLNIFDDGLFAGTYVDFCKQNKE